ncbi:hypothetical protein Tco_0007664 [Tanacetum coccineum]
MRETRVDLQSQDNYTLFREMMALPAQNINHSAFRAFYSCPEPVAEPDIVAQWIALYDAHTEIACLMLGSMTPELHRQFELYYPFDMIQELRSMFENLFDVHWSLYIQVFRCMQL